MKTKTNSSLALVSFLLINLGLGLVFFGVNNFFVNAQTLPEKVLIESKVKINAPNDDKLHNNEATVRDYIIKNSPLVIAKINLYTNIPIKLKLTQAQIEELQQYELTSGDGWKDSKLIINNPVEANNIALRYPYLAEYIKGLITKETSQSVVSNLIRTGNAELPQKLIVILPILFTLLFGSVSKLLSKN